MARINIDDKIFADPRFQALKLRMGDEEKALGRMVLVFRMALEYWSDDQKLIPIDLWDIHDYKIVEFVGFAERRQNGIYIKGTSQRAEWLREKVAAGRRSAEVRKEKFGSAVPKNASNTILENRTDPNRNRTELRTESEQPAEPPTPTPTPTPFLNTFPETAVAIPEPPKKMAKVKKPKDPAKGTATWEAYSKAFEAIHKFPPIRDAKSNAACAKLVDALGADKAPLVAAFYASRQETYLMQRKHPMGLLLSDCQKYAIEHAQSLNPNVSRVSGGLANEW